MSHVSIERPSHVAGAEQPPDVENTQPGCCAHCSIGIEPHASGVPVHEPLLAVQPAAAHSELDPWSAQSCGVPTHVASVQPCAAQLLVKFPQPCGVPVQRSNWRMQPASVQSLPAL